MKMFAYNERKSIDLADVKLQIEQSQNVLKLLNSIYGKKLYPGINTFKYNVSCTDGKI